MPKKELIDKSLQKLIKEKPYIVTHKPGFPNIGTREDKQKYGDAVRKIEIAWDFYDVSLYNIKEQKSTIKLGSGNPIDYKPFPDAVKALRHNKLRKSYQYPPAAGDEICRKQIVDYLIEEGFPKKLNIDNTIVTCSTTQGFYLILKSLFRPYDCIIMTAPNYGLFAFMPERLNMSVEVIELSEKNDYKLDVKELDKKILDINKKLKEKYKDKLDYVPTVRAFLNINPHNPLGTVLSNADTKLLKNISDVCKKHGVFIIDDLIYRDLSFNRDKIAKPIGTIPKSFDNTISLFGLSKSYGLANTRAGIIVANDAVIRLIRDNLFYIMDSAPYIQSLLLASTYNNTKKRKRHYNKYFKKVIDIYKYKCSLTIAMFEGIESVKDTKYYQKIKNTINKYLKNKEDYLLALKGIPLTKIKIIPQSGFFIIIDFTKVKDYSSINNEQDLLEYLYKKCNVKFLVGQSFSWPNEKEIIVRITYSLSDEELVKAFFKINIAIRELIESETN